MFTREKYQKGKNKISGFYRMKTPSFFLICHGGGKQELGSVQRVFPTAFALGMLRCSSFVVQMVQTDETVFMSPEEITFKEIKFVLGGDTVNQAI